MPMLRGSACDSSEWLLPLRRCPSAPKGGHVPGVRVMGFTVSFGFRVEGIF